MIQCKYKSSIKKSSGPKKQWEFKWELPFLIDNDN